MRAHYFQTLLTVISIGMVSTALIIKLGEPVRSESVSKRQSVIRVVTPSPVALQQFESEVTGQYTCLPPKNTKGPQTLECALGLKLDDGTYMALSFGTIQPNYSIGNRLTVTGIFVPIEQFSTDKWQKYNVSGIFQVASVEKQ